MAATELEYIFIVCRSIFDLLQELLRALWNRVELIDSSIQKRALPKYFADVVFSGDVANRAEDIANRRHLPIEWALAYARCAPFLQWLRQYRDFLVHGGTSFELVFHFPDGHGISIIERPFSKMPIWNATNTRLHNIGSLRSAACYVIQSTLGVLDRFADLVLRSVRLPPPFAPGYSLYICSPHIAELHRLVDGIETSPWYS